MIESWGVIVEEFGVVSGQGYEEEGANVMDVSIWVESAVLEYEPRCFAKTPGKILTMYWHTGGAPGCRYEGKSCVGNSTQETFEGYRFK